MAQGRHEASAEERFVAYVDEFLRLRWDTATNLPLELTPATDPPAVERESVERLAGFLQHGDVQLLTGPREGNVSAGVAFETLRVFFEQGLTIDRARALMWPKFIELWRLTNQRSYTRGVTKSTQDVDELTQRIKSLEEQIEPSRTQHRGSSGPAAHVQSAETQEVVHMWDMVIPVEPTGYEPIIWEGLTATRVLVLNAGPGTVELRAWTGTSGSWTEPPSIHMEMRPGSTRAVAGTLIRTGLRGGPFACVAAGFLDRSRPV